MTVLTSNDVSDLVHRAQLDRRDLQVLAAAKALRSLAGNRREALWQPPDVVPNRDMADTRIDDETPALGASSEAQELVSDYNTAGLSLGRHPLSLLRPALLEQRLMPASTLRTCRNGRLARGCGLVTIRQRPGTAKGVMFVTPEDEMGKVIVSVWPSPLEKQRRETLGAASLAVYGTWQCDGKFAIRWHSDSSTCRIFSAD
ncbi:DNA polymerase III subunit alpha [Caballeronia temeraria]|uniref:DNA polymerase III subunit alpha n=1 Tax=Caballeronia temeraria TaxID=1777137 RepID=A0A158DEX1_9BURK|nr:DNA polymerase III subunit alpha [Caballeronia temeraria]